MMVDEAKDLVNVDVIAAGLAELIRVQRMVSKPVPGCIPDDGVELDPQQLVLSGFCLQAEIYEVINEFSWKPWKQPRPAESKLVGYEVADVLAFLGVLLSQITHVTGLTAEALAEYYGSKSAVNIARIAGQVPGYGAMRGTINGAEDPPAIPKGCEEAAANPDGS